MTLRNAEETNEQARAAFQALLKHGVAEKTARGLVADYDVERIKWHIASFEKRRKEGKASGIGWLVDGIRSDYRPQASIFEQEEEEKRTRAQAERTRQASLEAEVERIKHACDEDNRKAGEVFLAGLAGTERERLNAEFLTRYGDVPQLDKRLKDEGLKSPLVRSLYLIFLREKYPRHNQNYYQYARANGASEEVLRILQKA